MRILELFCGIGAVSLAADGNHDIACAIDINQPARTVYLANFSSPHRVLEIESLTDDQLKQFAADLWWMSPPCQPFTRRGLKRDLQDPRTGALVRLIDAIQSIRPNHVAVENVIGFLDSQAFELLMQTFEQYSYSVDTAEMCSSDFGLPNLRPRCFVAASRIGKPELTIPQPASANSAGGPVSSKSIREFLDSVHGMSSLEQQQRWGELAVDPSQIKSYRHAINIVSPNDRISRCFTSAYGKSLVRSGSYLETDIGFRRFSPSEQARLLGFPEQFNLPESLNTRQLWKLLGNTVSVPCARQVIAAFDCL